jgi:hypothetical protein
MSSEKFSALARHPHRVPPQVPVDQLENKSVRQCATDLFAAVGGHSDFETEATLIIIRV